jgi:hypothetical protein
MAHEAYNVQDNGDISSTDGEELAYDEYAAYWNSEEDSNVGTGEDGVAKDYRKETLARKALTYDN